MTYSITYINNIFHVKMQPFVKPMSDQDPDRISCGSLDPDPH